MQRVGRLAAIRRQRQRPEPLGQGFRLDDCQVAARVGAEDLAFDAVGGAGVPVAVVEDPTVLEDREDQVDLAAGADDVLAGDDPALAEVDDPAAGGSAAGEDGDAALDALDVELAAVHVLAANRGLQRKEKGGGEQGRAVDGIHRPILVR